MAGCDSDGCTGRGSLRESKLSCLRRLLTRVGELTIVFTEYRDTLVRIASTIAPLTPIALLHGGLTREASRAAEERFTSGLPRRCCLQPTPAAKA